MIKAPKNEFYKRFTKFSNKQREKVYSKMDEVQKHRFDDFMLAGFHEKKVKELMQELMGSKNKIGDDVVQVVRVASKIYCG